MMVRHRGHATPKVIRLMICAASPCFGKGPQRDIALKRACNAQAGDMRTNCCQGRVNPDAGACRVHDAVELSMPYVLSAMGEVLCNKFNEGVACAHRPSPELSLV